LKQCWFDLAGSSLPHQIHTVKAFADPARIVWGSDFPYTSSPFGAELAADQRTTDATTEAEKQAILRDNARVLFADHLQGGIQ
jgi:predicted TIM-barrel fold metal-dependent hydrolase